MKEKSRIERGDIYYIEERRTEGNEIKKARPAIIVSADFLNKSSGTYMVVFLTTKPKKDMHTHTTVRSTGRLSETLCEQITTVSVNKIGKYVGKASKSEMERANAAMKTALDLWD